VLKECANADVFNIKLFGGEPFIHPDIVEITKDAYDKGFNISFTSNGTLISENILKEVGDYFTAGAISIHGQEKTHDKIVGKKGSFTKALEGLRKLIDYNIPAGVLFTLTKENINELSPLAKYLLENYEIGYFGVDRYVPIGRGTEKLSPSINEYNKAFSELLEIKKEYPNVMVELGDAFPLCLLEKPEYKEVVRGGCSAGISFCEIDGYGNLKICPSFPYSIGNILEEPLEELWQNNEILEKYRNLEINICDLCKSCSEFEECVGGCRASSPKGEYLLKYLKVEDKII